VAMKRFKYRLESYLKFQRFERDRALGEKKRSEEILQGYLDQEQVLLARIKQAYLDQTYISGNKRDLLLGDSALFLRRLAIEHENLQQEIHLAARDLERKQDKLIAMQKQVRSIERHRDLEKEKYRKQTLKREQKQVDELNQTRAGGKDAESL